MLRGRDNSLACRADTVEGGEEIGAMALVLGRAAEEPDEETELEADSEDDEDEGEAEELSLSAYSIAEGNRTKSAVNARRRDFLNYVLPTSPVR